MAEVAHHRAQRVLGALNFLLLGVALLLALLLVCQKTPPSVRLIPLLGPGESPAELQRPGGASQVLRSRVAGIGEYLTIEDLIRGALALEQGKLSAPSLTEIERRHLKALLEQASAHRDELLAIEEEINRLDRELDATARGMADTLTPAQREWIRAQRNVVSVGNRERLYWQELDSLLGDSP